MLKIAVGKTTANGWTNYDGASGGIRLDVDTSAAKFTNTPNYHVSLHSVEGFQWRSTGTTAIYNDTPTGFTVYIGWADWNGHGPNDPFNPLTAAFAQEKGWYVKWTGIETE